MNTRETEFIKWLTDRCRVRHYHCQLKNKIVEFMVQLEVKIKDKWYPVVRYDTAHNFSHQDIYHKDGRIDKIPLGISDYNIAMTFAEEELKKNWEIYIQRFLKEVDKNE